jgi:hypothetical protein
MATITITIKEYSKLLENKIRIDILRDFVNEHNYPDREDVYRIIGEPKTETEQVPGTEDDDF